MKLLLKDNTLGLSCFGRKYTSRISHNFNSMLEKRFNNVVLGDVLEEAYVIYHSFIFSDMYDTIEELLESKLWSYETELKRN